MKRLSMFLFLSLSFGSYCQDSLVLYFPFNSDKLTEGELTKIKRVLEKNASSVNTILGFSDSIGNYFYNIDLSERRAKNLFAYLSKENERIFSKTEVYGRGEMDFTGSMGRKVVIYYNQKIKNQIRTAKVGENIKIHNLNFEPGLEVLLPGSTPTLNELLEIMNEFPKLVIAIEGHICCDVHDETNLSGSRAKVVYDSLIRNGIKADRLSYKGFGSTKPIYPLPEQNDMQQVSNRRVEIRIVSKN
jgi:outer membrane protein OmpA-like peptidoglycan-associated protein